MAIEQEARQYVRVTGQGQPTIKYQQPKPEQTGPLPPETTLVREADTMASEQGYSEQGAQIGGKIVGYGSFSITLADGTRFTPQSKQDVVNVMAGELRGQYREQGERYIQEGYTPVVDESGNIQYVKSERQLLSPDYVPQRGDVQREPGGPIYNIPPEQQPGIRRDISQTIADMLGLSRMDTQEVYVMDPSQSRQELLDRGIVQQGPSQADIAIGLLSVPQGAFFVSGFKAIPEAAVRVLPFISGNVVRGVASVGTMAAGAAFGAKAIQDIVMAPSEQMRNFNLLMFSGQIATGMSVSGFRIGGLPRRVRAVTEAFKDKLPGYKEVRSYTDTGELRLYRHYDILGKDIRSPFYLKGERAVDLENLIRGYRPETIQTTMEGFRGNRIISVVKGETRPVDVLLSERLGSPKRIFVLSDIIKTGSETAPIKPYTPATGIQLKLFPSEKASAPMTLTDIVKKTEPLVTPKTKTSALTFDDLVRGRGEKIWVEGDRIVSEELERLSSKELVKRRYTLSDITRKPLYDLTKSVEVKSGENIVQVLETVKPSRTVRADTMIESPDIRYVAGSPKLLNFLLTLEAGIGLSSEHWKDVKPGFKGTVKGQPSTDRSFVSSEGLLSFSFMEKRRVQGEFNINDVVTGEIDLSDVLQNQMTRQNERQDLGRLSLVTPVDITGLARRSAQHQSLNQRQQLISDQMLEQIVMYGTESITESAKGRILPGVPGLEEGVSIGGFILGKPESRPYIVQFRGRQYWNGKKVGDDQYHDASKPYSEDDARSWGMNVAGNTEKASYRLRPSDKKPVKLRQNIPDWRDRFLEFDMNEKGAMVEKSLYRIDSPGELRMITMKGIEANRGRHKR